MVQPCVRRDNGTVAPLQRATAATAAMRYKHAKSTYIHQLRLLYLSALGRRSARQSVWHCLGGCGVPVQTFLPQPASVPFPTHLRPHRPVVSTFQRPGTL